MAGSANRIYNFCKSFPSSSGCPFPPRNVPPYVDPCIDPFSIGTNYCKTYVAYVNANPSPSLNTDNLVSERTPIIQQYPTTATPYLGYTSITKANLYSAVDAAGTLSNKIGFLLYKVTALYDTPSVTDGSTGPANVTAEVTSNWWDGTALKASLQAQFTYHLTSTAAGSGYPGPFSSNSFSTGQQLYGKNVKVDSSVIAPSGKYINKLVFNIL